MDYNYVLQPFSQEATAEKTDPSWIVGCPHCGGAIDVTGIEIGSVLTCPHCGKLFTLTREFAGYTLIRALGSGGMGTVYLAYDSQLNRTVAVKVLRESFSQDPKFVANFNYEAAITASINHPNIVQVYGSGLAEGRHYIVMEYISGGSLDDRIQAQKRLPEADVIDIGLAVARGLSAALSRGLIHRDIKPGNILFNSLGTPKIVDFGLSLIVGENDHFTGEIWGTPYYLAPEKLLQRQEDFRSDMYSLGATLFHALAGRPPYQEEDADRVALRHLQGAPVLIATFVPDLSPQMIGVIQRCMERDPERRFPNYQELIAQLEDAKRRLSLSHAIVPAQTIKRPPAAKIRNPADSDAIALVLMVATVLAIGLLLAVAIIYHEQIFGS
ncbi:MAG: serine/threonine protein kinase [Methylacidiphilales bacterium]|nr:serine/threonine protein kinase [Candidatus Methylacidiphilales bacterium]MDW8349317.1 protein kinase [Verrucomicrobiae bacterium]